MKAKTKKERALKVTPVVTKRAKAANSNEKTEKPGTLGPGPDSGPDLRTDADALFTRELSVSAHLSFLMMSSTFILWVEWCRLYTVELSRVENSIVE